MKIKMPPLPGKKILSAHNLSEKVDQKSALFFQAKPYNNLYKKPPVNRYSIEKCVSTRSIKSSTSNRSISKGSSRSMSKQISFGPNTNKSDSKLSLPTITSKSWGVYQMKQKRLLAGKKTTKKREVASLTKIMNLVTILDILKTHKIETEKVKVRVTAQASKMIGTTANIKEGDVYRLQDLFYGMMLPSGNDAAYLVAQVGGAIINFVEKGTKKQIYSEVDLWGEIKKGRNCVFTYLSEMNKISKALGMGNTKWSNAHGLSNKENYTNIHDMSLLCMHAMKESKFKQIVETKEYSCIVNSVENKENTSMNDIGFSKVVFWENTNKMLKEGWDGIKTGITPNAGPCLSASVTRTLDGKSYHFLVLLAASQSMESRWKQVDSLVNWVITNQLY